MQKTPFLNVELFLGLEREEEGVGEGVSEEEKERGGRGGEEGVREEEEGRRRRVE